MPNGRSGVMLAAVLLLLAATANAQTISDDTVSSLLGQFTSTDQTARMVAFYGLLNLGAGPNVSAVPYPVPAQLLNVLQNVSVGSLDQIKVDLIAVLSLENNNIEQSYQFSNSPTVLTEDYTDYYADLIAAVVTLKDQRSIRSLAGAIRSGNMATGALAAFGDASIDVLLQQMTTAADDLAQFSSLFAMEGMLDTGIFPKLSVTTIGKLRQAFIQASQFSNTNTASEATRALAKLNSLAGTVPPVTTAALSPQPNAGGWNNTNVTVTLNSADNEPGGTGVKEIQWSLTGAQAGASTVPGNTTTVTISAEGTTTLTYFGTDNAGNIETAKSITVKIDKTPPVITASANPSSLWPPNGRMVNVTVSASITDNLSGVDPNSTIFAVVDKYGTVQPSGSLTIGPNGTYSFTVALQAARLGTDLAGRSYAITVAAQDKAGNRSSASTTVVIPHDQGH
jgi:hypothetical protein